MSREILFRGKRIDNGKWVQGYVCRSHRHRGSLDSEIESYYFNELDDNGWASECVVSAETVCQYTGKSDDNKNKIWEEDFVKINGEWIGRVIWRDDVTAFCVFPNDDLEREIYCLGFYIEEGYKVEVIGNIFDNPELLESEGRE